ncbi:MAG: branched-chain amino acid transport system permease protein [Acidimicrobiaceae bacterium]|jgi:branched-chain amino acid transport system permease protein|nr:branched-chain amino acid transport system permease protein [Acidimicrobiaceae bacterium]
MLAAIHFANLYKQFWPSTVDGITTGAIYALVALGYTLVYGVLRLINFAHSEVFMLGTVGALVGATVVGLGPTDPTRSGLALVGTFLVCLAFSMAFSGGTAVALERLAYRPLRRRGASRLAALISAIGASLFLEELFAQNKLFAIGHWRFNMLGRGDHFLHNLIKPTKIVTIFQGAIISVDKVVVIVGAVVMMIALDRFVSTSRLGRGIRAVAQDAETATLMGVNIDRVISLTFLLGGLMAGVAGLLYMVKIQQTNYFVGFLLGIKAFTAAVLGGIGNLRGALVGGFALGLVEIYGASVFGAQWLDVVAFVVLVVVLMFRPTGLLGEALMKARA